MEVTLILTAILSYLVLTGNSDLIESLNQLSTHNYVAGEDVSSTSLIVAIEQHNASTASLSSD